MKKAFPLLFILFALSNPLFSQDLVIAVSDFKVESDNPNYKYLGKGISRLVASELRKSGKVQLVEREQINRVLAEQEFSLSDLTDQSKQVRIGKLLSARYLVIGEIIDMGAAGVLVSVRLVNSESGAIVAQDEKQEKLAVYDYMGAYFAQSLLGPIGVSASASTIAKIEAKAEKQPEAIIKTSEGIDAYDHQDTATAQKTLEEAKRIDPANDVANEYLAKLIVNTAKFKILLEPYYADQNPAYLGILKMDKLYLVNTEPLVVQFTQNPMNLFKVPLPGGRNLVEWDYRAKLGYSFPVGQNLGFDAACIFFGVMSGYYGSVVLSGLGGLVDGGLKLSDSVAIGCGLALYAESNIGVVPFANAITHPAFAFSLGMLVRNPDDSVTYDVQAGWATGRISQIDPATGLFNGTAGLPLFIENTLTFGLNQKHTFIIVKQLNDISFDRVFYYGRIIPALEHFLVDWLSVRVGGELAYIRQNNSDMFGYGGTGGFTVRIIPWGLEIDFNVTFRMRPSQAVPGYLYPDLIGLIGFSLNKVFISR